MEWIAIAVVIGVIVLIFTYWKVSLALAVLGTIAYFLIEAEKKKEARDKAERERQAALEKAELEDRKQRRAEQESIQRDLGQICTRSLDAFENMPKHLLNAEKLLDRAESDFRESAFAPFWDSVQSVATLLGRFQEGLQLITTDSVRHGELSRKFEGTPPQFPIKLESVNAMAAANATAGRFQTVVRKAQCNFQFATIYEQRKTNQILVAGFQNLAQAIDGLGDRIESSIDNLGRKITEMSRSLGESLSDISSSLGQSLSGLKNIDASVKDLHSATQQVSSDQAQRHDKALAMLDNIQRRRIPRPRKFGDQSY